MDIQLIETLKIKGKRILAVGAHPDDIEFGAAGTLAALAKNNAITFLIVTDGRMGTHESSINPQELVKIREEETRASAKILCAEKTIFYNYPDTNLLSYKKNFYKRFLKDLLKIRPDIIFSFDPWGRYEPFIHPDHRVVSWAVVEGILFSTLPVYLKKHGISASPLNPKPENWLFAASESNIAVDITNIFDKKIEALKSHKSQFDEVVKFDVMISRVKERAKEAGKMAGVEYAELFRILK